MPAWKSEILERRRAKVANPGMDSFLSINASTITRAPEKNSEAFGTRDHMKTFCKAEQPNISAVGNSEELLLRNIPSCHTCRKDTLNQKNFYQHCKEESLVLQESIRPIKENHFIKLEKERRRQLKREALLARKPIQQLLEVCSNIPGVRTVRAENIIIIESDSSPDQKSLTNARNRGNAYNSVDDLLSERGSSVTEIRASEVVIYEPVIGKSEKNLSNFYAEKNGQLNGIDCWGHYGRVSKLLQKFDQNYTKPLRSKAPENLLVGRDHSHYRERKSKPYFVPKFPVTDTSPFMVYQKMNLMPKIIKEETKAVIIGRKSPVNMTDGGREQMPSSNISSIELLKGHKTSLLKPGEDFKKAYKPPFKIPRQSVTSFPKALKPTSILPDTLKLNPKKNAAARVAPPPLKGVSASASQTDSLKVINPVVASISNTDTARTKMQSKISFAGVPKQKHNPSLQPSDPPVCKTTSEHHLLKATSEEETRKNMENAPPHAFLFSMGTEQECKSPWSYPSSEKSPFFECNKLLKAEEKNPSVGFTSINDEDSEVEEKLPVTNIDDMVNLETMKIHSSILQHTVGNTFTVLPKAKQITSEKRSSGVQVTSVDRTTKKLEPSYTKLGTLPKMQYPTVDDIEVVGGYLSLDKSCLSKTGFTRKKMKISFNEESLCTTFEYPSESSMLRAEEEEEVVEAAAALESEDEIFLFPVPNLKYTFCSLPSSPLQMGTQSRVLYSLKQTVAFTEWWEQKRDENVSERDLSLQDGPETVERTLLTPADYGTSAGFSSEPALYF
uniref:Uncharacterized protein n=1 Tax=Latimeria chalumnae TaxID=7897 RepID=H3BBK0_LATCH